MTYRFLLAFLFYSIISMQSAFSSDIERVSMHFPATGHSSKEVVKLNGEWQFYYGKHLTAAQMQNLPVNQKQYIAPPLNWKNLTVNGEHLSAIGIATFYLRIVIDTNRLLAPNEYAFRTADIQTAYKMFVNNQLVMSVGSATLTNRGFKPGYYPHVGYIHTNKDTLNVVLHVSNFLNPLYAGISRHILFGQEESLSRKHLLISALNIFLMCLFAVLFSFELMVFLALPNEKSHLMVCLLSLFLLIKMLAIGEMPIDYFLPNFSYFVAFRFWILYLLFIPVLFSLIRQYFPDEINHRTILIVHSLFGVYALMAIFLPVPWILAHLAPIIYIAILCLIYLYVVVTLAMIRRRKFAVVHFISFTIVFFCQVYDMALIGNPNKVIFLSHYGFAVYLIIQASIILFRFIEAHELTVKLSNELESTNLKLEETVENRTAELREANINLEKINRQKNFMLATTTHDLKNSFNILIGCSGFLAEEKDLTEEQRVYADLIQDATKNGYRVLENILSWARMQMTDYVGTNVITDLRALMDQEIQSFQKQCTEKELQVSIEIDDELHFICDKEQLYSVLRNLLSNAIKFCRTGGEIVLSNSLVNGMVECSLRDNGIGMDSSLLDTLFDNTIDSKRRGTSGEMGSGLGLIIVKELVESNKGTIRCLSEPGKGTEFILQFPRVSDQAVI